MNKTLLGMLITTLLAFQVKAEDNKATWLVDIGDAVSLTAHICTLKNDASMKDIARIDNKLHKFMDDNDIRGMRQILAPLFATGTSYDYIAFDFMTWAQFGKNWDLALKTKVGNGLMADYAEVEDCDAMIASVFPLMRKESNFQLTSSISVVEWCTRMPGVSQQQLGEKHRTVAAETKDSTTATWWGVGYQAGGLRDGLFPGDFFHLVSYPDMNAFAASRNDIANNGGWKMRSDYYTSYADCSGEHILAAERVRRR